MEGCLGPYSIQENKLYLYSSPATKVWMGILEEGLLVDKRRKLVYTPRPLDLRKLQKRLGDKRDNISPNYVDIPLDELIDDGLIEARWPERIKNENGEWIWTRTYRVHPDVLKQALQIFNALHWIYKN